MTPEQVERTIEFILEHQAQVTVHMERITVHMEQATVHMQQLTGQTRNVQAAVLILSELAQIQSSRLDRQGEEFQALLKYYDEGRKEALARLDEILRRLTEKEGSN